MTRAPFAYCLLFFLLIGASGAHAAASAQPAATNVGEWLAKAAQAVRTSSYRGVMVHLRKDELDTMRIIHRYHNNIEQERLISLTGRPREILRHGSRVISILPENKVVLITHHEGRDNLLARVGQFSSEEMQKHYQMRVLDSRRLADRPARVISIQPRDKYRYGYRILVDEDTYLPLKLNLIQGDQVLEQLVFTEIAYPDSIPDEALEAGYDIQDFEVITHGAIQASNPQIADTEWHSSKLPPGFRLAESGIRSTESGQLVRQLLFTDGVATVSAFIAPVDGQEPMNGGTTMGAVNAYGHAEGDYQITVVGEVPAVTVQMIAEHLEHNGQKP
ncbi:MAG TPA: MucB/RseB C-terminal domain-containing protein [Salinisphaeraceae bacterium]|nr:MucB/RseB C-terminal domain-containing protein [Salinisphaeraceae bacterium]